MKIKVQSRVISIKTLFSILIFLVLIVEEVHSVSAPLCHITCSPTNCDSSLSTGCNSCAPYFLNSSTAPSSCNFDTSLTTVKLSKTKTDLVLSSNPTSNCTALYFYSGQYLNNSEIIITSITPITEPHYQVELVAWLILIDQWPSGTYVDFKLVSTGQNIAIGQSGTSVNDNYCGSGANDGYARFNGTFIHTDVLNNIRFNVTTTYTHSSAKLGIGEILIISHLCHSNCKVCTGPTATVCSECNFGFFQSGTTCAAACLTGYGSNPPSNICIACHSYCTSCCTVSTNCTTCVDTILIGTNSTASQIYKVQDANACEAICPTGYYGHLATKKCLSCALRCVSMTISSQLISNNSSLEFLYTFSQAMDFTGFNYLNFLGFNNTNTSVNIVSDFNIAYLMVDSTHFKLTLTAKPTKHLVDADVCTIIKSQASNSYQYSFALNKLGPSVYTSYNCIRWTTPQANLSITNLINPSPRYIEFIFTFTAPMTWTGFMYTDFVNLNESDSLISLSSNFTVAYQSTGTQSFKLKLTPNSGTYFVNTIFCAITKPQASTSLQFSQNNFKLHPSVYGQENCLTWSIPPVNLSLSSQILLGGQNLEFSFTFTSPMDWSGFVYLDFVVLNQSDASVSLSGNFTIAYQAVGTQSFKLKLTPNLGSYFVDTVFCATTKAQTSTNLQLSQDLYKLHPSVYGQQNCLTWSISPVNLSLSGQIALDRKYLEFTFSFTYPIDFTNFDYTDFAYFSLNMTNLAIGTNFTVVYSQLNSQSFKLQLTPKNNTNFQNLQICSTTESKTNTALQLAQDNKPLELTVYGKSLCLVWSTIQPIPLPTFEYAKNLEIMNNQIEDFTTQKGTQEIIKSGALTFIMPGAQLSSTVLLHSPRINQNLYEGTRFWGSFVFFDVPPYEQSSNKTKYTFNSADQEIVQNSKQRRLQQDNSTKVKNFINEWKFDRTGHTGFFMFDTYLQLILIASAWILYLLGWIYEHKCNQSSSAIKINTRIMVFFHKIHQMSLFYFLLSALIEYKNFDSSNQLHTVSMIISAIVLVYYLIYELKIFYDIINYPKATIGSKMYLYYVKKYAFFIAYYRFEQYNDKNQWTWRHFLRPYNYHTLTFIKKALMLSAIPIFYDHGLSPVVILTILQAMDVVRFLITIPYQRFWRNFLYFGIQALLLTFFICSLINQYVGLKLLDENGIFVDQSYLSTYKNSGIVGLVVIFVYNILYSLSSILQLGIILVTKSSFQNMVWANRNAYYQDLYEHFQQYGSYYRLVKNYTDQLAYNRDRRDAKSFKAWVNKLHDAEPIVDLSQQKLKVFKQITQRGNILTADFQENQIKQTVEVRIEIFKIKDFQRFIRMSHFGKPPHAPKNEDNMLKKETQSSQNYNRHPKAEEDTRSLKNLSINYSEDQIFNFEIEYQIVPAIFRSSSNNRNCKNGVYIPKKIKNLISSDILNPHFQKNLAMTLISYQMPGTEEIKLSTFLKIHLASYKQDQNISFKREDMRQEIIIKRGRNNTKIDLKEVLSGFPVDWEALQITKQSEANLSQTNTPLKRQTDSMDENFVNVYV